MALIVAACFAVGDWKLTLLGATLLLLISMTPSAIRYFIAFIFAFIQYRSIRKAHCAARNIAKDLFVGIFDKLNGEV